MSVDWIITSVATAAKVTSVATAAKVFTDVSSGTFTHLGGRPRGLPVGTLTLGVNRIGRPTFFFTFCIDAGADEEERVVSTFSNIGFNCDGTGASLVVVAVVVGGGVLDTR